MPTLTEIAKRNGIALDHLRDLDAVGRLPEPIGANSYGRLYDERGVLAVIMPAGIDSAALEARAFARGQQAARLFIRQGDTEKARTVRRAVVEFDEHADTVTEAAKRCGCGRPYFYAVLESWRGLHENADFLKDSAK